MAGHDRLWPAMAGHGRPWQAKAGQGRPRPAQAGHGRPWPAKPCHGGLAWHPLSRFLILENSPRWGANTQFLIAMFLIAVTGGVAHHGWGSPFSNLEKMNITNRQGHQKNNQPKFGRNCLSRKLPFQSRIRGLPHSHRRCWTCIEISNRFG